VTVVVTAATAALEVGRASNVVVAEVLEVIPVTVAMAEMEQQTTLPLARAEAAAVAAAEAQWIPQVLAVA
jgi:hypothetical protein